LDGLFFFWVFGTPLPNQVERTWIKLNPLFVIMSEVNIFLLMGILTKNFNTMDHVKGFGKNQNLHKGHIEGDIM
jgi:hypothetical protein